MLGCSTKKFLRTSCAFSSASAGIDSAVHDLGPLAWVVDELRKSLEASSKALKRFVRDAEAARSSDLAAIDTNQLRIARQQLHQVTALPGICQCTPPWPRMPRSYSHLADRVYQP